MIFTIICFAVFFIGLVILSIDDTNFIGLAFTFCAGIAGVLLIAMIILAHIGVPNQIEKNRIQYESLMKRIEIINSDYEDMSKSDVIRDVAEWNKQVISDRYWCSNPWTSWFYDKDVVNEMEVIDI